MDEVMKRRLIGAVVIVGVAVIVLPMFLGGHRATRQTGQTGSEPSTSQGRDVKTVTIPLNGSEQQHGGQSTPSQAPQPSASAAPPAPTASPDTGNTGGAVQTQQAAQTSPQPAGPSASQSAGETAKPAKPASKPSPQPASTQTQQSKSGGATAGNGNWGVQVGSFSDAGNAQALASKLQAQGFSAFVASAQVGSQTYHRVRVGPVQTKNDAAKLGQRVESVVGHGVQVVPVQ